MVDETNLLHIAEKLQSSPYEQLNENQKIFLTIWDMEIELNNGGYSQYFFNSSGRYAHEAADNLILIGAHNCERLLNKAIEALNISFENWKVDELRQDQVANADESVEDEFDRLDSLFYQYPDDLCGLLTRFVSCHPAEFDI